MSQYFSIANMLGSAGPTLIVLFICSLISIIIIIERLLYYGSQKPDAGLILDKMANGTELTEKEKDTALGYVLGECLDYCQNHPKANSQNFEEIKNRAIAEKLPQMERYIAIEATLGTVSPYIGLLGTVFGIIQAFTSLGGDPGAEGSLNGLNAGIAHALVATAGGLIVAIPATIAYNYFKKQVKSIVLEIEIAASRLKISKLKD